MPPEIRRVQLTGGSTLIVSLPRSWVTSYGLKKGDEVVICEQPNGVLTIVPKGVRMGECEVVVKSGDDPVKVVRRVISFYLAGYEVIKLVFSVHDIETVKTVKSYVRRWLVGAEVVDESHSSLTIQVMPIVQNMPPMRTIERMGTIAYHMLSDALDAVMERDAEMALEVINRDDEVDRFYYHFYRMINSSLMSLEPLSDGVPLYPHDAISYLMASRSIERVADHATNVASMVTDGVVGREAPSKLIGLGREAAELFRSSVGLLLSPAIDSIEKSFASGEELLSLTQQIYSKVVKRSSALSERMLYYNVRRVIEYSMDICENALNVATPKPRLLRSERMESIE